MVRARPAPACRCPRPRAAVRAPGAGTCSRTPARPSSGNVSTTGTSPTVSAQWVRSESRNVSVRPTQVHEPANRCRRSQARTSSLVYAGPGSIVDSPNGRRAGVRVRASRRRPASSTRRQRSPEHAAPAVAQHLTDDVATRDAGDAAAAVRRAARLIEPADRGAQVGVARPPVDSGTSAPVSVHRGRCCRPPARTRSASRVDRSPAVRRWSR